MPSYQPGLSFGSPSGDVYLASNSGSLPLAPSSIYEQAIRISSPRLMDEGAAADPNAPRRVVRQVEVPFVRQVKTAVSTRQLVPFEVQKKVKVKRLVEQPSTRLVTEEYTEVVHQPAIRNKEIWVKRVVPERYSQPISVRRTRQVAVPTTVLKQIDDYDVVTVTENRPVDVTGYRVDEVQDSMLVETEELQHPSLNPYGAPTQAQVLAVREIGPVHGFHHSRRLGTEVFHPADQRIAHVEEDSAPFSGTVRPTSSPGFRPAPAAASSSPLRASGQRISGGGYTNGYSNGTSRVGANANPLSQSMGSMGSTGPLSSSQALGGDEAASLGFKVRDGDMQGVVVYRVAGGSAAERAGLRTADVIIYVNNRPARNLPEFRSVIGASVGPVLLHVRRRGMQKLMLTVHR